jgi:gas vesicle protein
MFLGVALGLLLAPHRGEVTRRKIARRAGEAREEVKKAVEDLRERRGDQGEEDDEEV